MDTASLLSELAAIVGPGSLDTDPASVGFALPASWEAKPLAALSPHTIAEVAGVVRAVEAAGAALIPCGGGTQFATGYPPRADRPYLLVRTDRMDRVLDYQPDDLTITGEPGVPLARLQQTLAERGQFLALDVPLPERATLGGIVATNASGFWRPAYGAPRDLLIGLRAVMAGGVEVKGGGKVVKNVAGYDVCKLFTGAWGTLGVLTELTFKVRPLPETDRTFAWKMPDVATAARLGLDLHHARLALTYLLATNEMEGVPHLVVGLQGTAARVEWQQAEVARRIAAAGGDPAPATLTAAAVSDLRDCQARRGSGITYAARLACLPTEVAGLLLRLETLPGLALTAHVATGIVHFAAASPAPAPIPTLQSLLPAGANVVWIRLEPSAVDGEKIAVWGEAREDFALQRALKQSLDPQNTFSPGCFLGHL